MTKKSNPVPHYTSAPINGVFYHIEPVRDGSHKLLCVRLPVSFPPGDPAGVGIVIHPRAVPLAVRRAARASLNLIRE